MNMVATDYAWLMTQMERHNREMHDACLNKQWELARNHAIVIEKHLDALIEWLDGQEEGENGRFQEIWMP